MIETETVKPVRGSWDEIREAYLTRVPIPTITELSIEFNRHISQLSRMSNEENWAGMRAAKAEQSLKEAGASELVLKALQGEGKIIQSARNLAASFILALQMVVDKVAEECAETKSAASARTLNDLGFAMNNVGNFVDKTGLVGMPMDLRKSRANSDGNAAGQIWEKGMLQQINVTVQNLQGQAKAAAKVEAAQPAIAVAEEET